MTAYTKVSPRTLNDMLQENKVFLIDVREVDEYEKEHIKGAHLFPKSTLNPEQIFKAAGKNASICVQCRSGARSAEVAQILADALAKAPQYKRIKLFDLVGGINAWKEAPYPVTSGSGILTPYTVGGALLLALLLIAGVRGIRGILNRK